MCLSLIVLILSWCLCLLIVVLKWLGGLPELVSDGLQCLICQGLVYLIWVPTIFKLRLELPKQSNKLSKLLGSALIAARILLHLLALVLDDSISIWLILIHVIIV